MGSRRKRGRYFKRVVGAKSRARMAALYYSRALLCTDNRRDPTHSPVEGKGEGHGGAVIESGFRSVDMVQMSMRGGGMRP